MQPKVQVALAITYMVLVGGCDADPFSPRLRSAAEQAQAAHIVGSSLTTFAVSANEIDLSWQDNSLNEIGWEVHRSTTGSAGVFTLLATLPTGATSYANTGLTQQTEYCYKVRSFRKAGSRTTYASFFNTSCNTTPAAPAPPPAPEAPSNLSVIPAVSVIWVTWSDNSATEIGFRIQRSGNIAGPFDDIATVNGNQVPDRTARYSDFAPLEQQVCYRVVAFSGDGTSDPSNVDCTALPKAPTDLAAQSLDGHSIDLTWSDNSAFEDSYEVSRSVGHGAFAAIDTVPANATSYHDASVTSDVRHYYNVRALKDGGSSYYSSIASTIIVSGPPAAPTELSAVPKGSTAIAVNWMPSANTEGNRLERSLDGGSSWATAALTGFDQFSFRDAGLSSEQQVCYRIFAVNTAGESPASNTDCTTPPAAATDFAATYNADGSADLRWKDNSGVEDAYVVLASYIDWSPNVTLTVAYLGPNTESYRLDDTSLYAGAYLTVVAAKDEGYSDWAVEAPAGASQAVALSTSMTKDRRITSRSGRHAKPLDAGSSSPRKLRP